MRRRDVWLRSGVEGVRRLIYWYALRKIECVLIHLFAVGARQAFGTVLRRRKSGLV